MEFTQVFTKIQKSPDKEQGPVTAGFDPTLGPSGPHEHGDDPEVGAGAPPPITKATPHYTNVLDQLRTKFDEPEERSAVRLLAVIDTCADEAVRVHQLSMDMFEELPTTKIPEAVRVQFRQEFLDYARRLHGYKQRLLDLEPNSLDTDEVHLGLIERRPGTGPVPDAIMHLYFANQLGVLADHAHDMGKGFVGRVMTALEGANSGLIEAVKVVDESGRDAQAAAGDFWAQVRELRWWIVGGAVATVGTSVGVAVGLSRLGRGASKR